MLSVLKQLREIFNKSDRYKLLFLMALVIVSSALETIGIGLIFPFINLVSNPSLTMGNSKFKYMYDLLGFNEVNNFIIAVGLLLIAFYIFKNFFIAANFYIQQSFIALKRAEISSKLYRYYLKKDYLFHSNNTSGMILRDLNLVDSLFSNFIAPFFAIVSELLTMLLIISLLYMTNPEITVIAAVAIGIPAILSNRFTSKIFKQTGQESFDYIGKSSQTVLDGLRGIKEIQSMNKWSVFTKKLFGYNVNLGKIRAKLEVLNNIPRLLFETIITSGIVVILLYFVHKGVSSQDFFSVIALFGAAAVKLLSSASKILQKLNIFNFASTLKDSLLEDVIEATKDRSSFLDSSNSNKLKIQSKIEVNNLYFKYPNTSMVVLNDVSLSIKKGEKVALVGLSGAGKSTLMNILLGLLDSTRGEILIDDKNITKLTDEWHNSIGYIPQNITLFDISLKENIAFGVNPDKIDIDKIKELIKITNLDQFVSELDEGLETKLGENGAKVSGGQKQRIALARALYSSPQVIFLDEATSALDNQTEKLVVEALQNLNPEYTIVMIAHRLSTVRNCDRIFFMDDGKITHVGTYDELIATCPKFNSLTIESKN